MILNIGDKIGYYSASTGRYKYIPVIAVLPQGYQMKDRIPTGKNTSAEHIFIEPFADVERITNAGDKFSKGKPYMKIKKATPGIPQNTIEINF